MKRTSVVLAITALLAILHTDFWWWNDSSLVFGLPVGLTYHLVFCLVAAIGAALLVRFAWPENLAAADD